MTGLLSRLFAPLTANRRQRDFDHHWHSIRRALRGTAIGSGKGRHV